MSIIADKPDRWDFPTQLVGDPKVDTPAPEVALLSNGRYSVMITATGAGSSSWRDLDVTRWQEDGTRDCWGQFIYVRDQRDQRDGARCSIGHPPFCRTADQYEVLLPMRDDGNVHNVQIVLGCKLSAELLYGPRMQWWLSRDGFRSASFR